MKKNLQKSVESDFGRDTLLMYEKLALLRLLIDYIVSLDYHRLINRAAHRCCMNRRKGQRAMIDRMTIRFNEAVWHDQVYMHPQLRVRMPRDFFNCAAEKAQIERIVKTSKHKVAAITGERRTGKTSLLKLLIERLERDSSDQFLPVFVPWQGVVSSSDLGGDILYAAHQRIIHTLPSATALDIDLPNPASAQEFVATIQRLLALQPGKTIVIAIDEIDSILEGALGDEQDRIADLLTPLAESADLPVRLALAMTRIPESARGSRLFDLTRHAGKVRLRPFSQADFNIMVGELLGAQVALPTDQIQRLFELAGGWPYFGKLLLSAFAETPAGEQWFERMLTAALANPNVNDTLRNIYTRHLDEHEKAVVLLLSQGRGTAGAAQIAAAGPDLAAAAARLDERDILVTRPDGGYTFRVGFIAEWLPKWPKYAEEVERRLGWLADL
jgi:hypothetical protein